MFMGKFCALGVICLFWRYFVCFGVILCVLGLFYEFYAFWSYFVRFGIIFVWFGVILYASGLDYAFCDMEEELCFNGFPPLD